MLTRRGFLKGLLSSVAAGVFIKNGIVQPEQVLAEPKRWTIDMAANTWRQRWTTLSASFDGRYTHVAIWDRELSTSELLDLTGLPIHVNCRCTLPMPLQVSQELLDDAQGGFLIPKHISDDLLCCLRTSGVARRTSVEFQWYEQVDNAYQDDRHV